MSSIIDLGQNIEDMEEYVALPDGTYTAQIRDVETKTSEKVPTGYFVISLLVDPEEFPPDYDAANAPQGVNLTYARVSVPTAENRRSVKPFRDLLKAMGMDVKGSTVDTADWIGKEIQVMLKEDEYQGSATNNIQAIGPVPSV